VERAVFIVFCDVYLICSLLASSLRLTAAEPECRRVWWILKIAFIHSINNACCCKWMKQQKEIQKHSQIQIFVTDSDLTNSIRPCVSG